MSNTTYPTSQVYNENEIATLQATEGEGYEFYGWYDGDQYVTTDNPYSFVVQGDRNLKGVFKTTSLSDVIKITFNSDNCEISVNGTTKANGSYDYYAPGSRLQLSADNITSGYQFMNWKITKNSDFEIISTETE